MPAPQVTRPSTMVMHVRSGDLFTAWRNGNRTFTHAGYNSQMSGRGQPPLGFYLRAMAHRQEESALASTVLVTSPDRASPVVRALELLSATNALRVPRLRISASASFATDLQLLLCARSLVLATSTLSELIADSPNLRDAYRFGRSCPPPTEKRCARPPPSATAATREWCVTREGVYSPVDGSWDNTDAQQLEMLLGGNATWPTKACHAPG